MVSKTFTGTTKLKEELYGTCYNIHPIEESVIQVSSIAPNTVLNFNCFLKL